MSGKRITRVSREDLDKMESLTDWERVSKLTDEEIAAAAADDPDTSIPTTPGGRSSWREAGSWCRRGSAASASRCGWMTM